MSVQQRERVIERTGVPDFCSPLHVSLSRSLLLGLGLRRPSAA